MVSDAWKATRSEQKSIRYRYHLIVRCGRSVEFWKELWCKIKIISASRVIPFFFIDKQLY